ncbi:type II toxin-antitoxin system RelE/ParE family toxin [uncultured Desulfobacter sp.]|uniref:type II toxin-antitoxin system RelE/ParE family toxin n=1 Tax=uncultured Desulfobacter sp. TaxID=240139 RepID=UPI0029F5B55A|nr:type II toxin-antitoxin system RelE/ParE family toxin [uncultured Desulfobacter sp.]
MIQYILSPNAQKSLRDIKAYSLEEFGKEQTILYLKLIEKKLQMIAESPDIGRKREEIKKGYLSFLAGSHVIFYRKAKNHVDIIDILHQSMEPYRHLKA